MKKVKLKLTDEELQWFADLCVNIFRGHKPKNNSSKAIIATIGELAARLQSRTFIFKNGNKKVTLQLRLSEAYSLLAVEPSFTISGSWESNTQLIIFNAIKEQTA